MTGKLAFVLFLSDKPKFPHHKTQRCSSMGTLLYLDTSGQPQWIGGSLEPHNSRLVWSSQLSTACVWRRSDEPIQKGEILYLTLLCQDKKYILFHSLLQSNFKHLQHSDSNFLLKRKRNEAVARMQTSPLSTSCCRSMNELPGSSMKKYLACVQVSHHSCFSATSWKKWLIWPPACAQHLIYKGWLCLYVIVIFPYRFTI